MNIPYINISEENLLLKEKLLNAASRVIDHGQFINGPEVLLLEKKLSKYLEVKNVIGVANGTAALFLSLKGLGIGKGDEVITVGNSYLATVSSIALTGAKPILIDVDDTMNMNPNLLEAAITSKTKAILPVHLTGKPSKILDIYKISKKYNIPLIEDAAQAIGAEYKGKKIGSFGKTACFSLHPLKNLSALGDGGFIATNDDDLAFWLRRARNHGHPNRDECDFWSFNMRLDTIQAAFILEKLPYLEEQTERRRFNANYYRENLSDLDLVLPIEENFERCVNHLFVIRLKNRDSLKIYMHSKGIETKIHYPIPIHKLKAADKLNFNLPKTEEYANLILSLPIHSGLSEKDLADVTSAIYEFKK